MAAGRASSLSSRDRARIGAAVRDAERTTGLQIAVAIGETTEDARSTAERLFVEQGLVDRPAVFVLVAPEHREVQVITSVEAHERVSDAECASAVETMTARFAGGDLVGGLVEGVAHIAEAAGLGAVGGSDGRSAPDLPDLID